MRECDLVEKSVDRTVDVRVDKKAGEKVAYWDGQMVAYLGARLVDLKVAWLDMKREYRLGYLKAA